MEKFFSKKNKKSRSNNKSRSGYITAYWHVNDSHFIILYGTILILMLKRKFSIQEIWYENENNR